MLKVDVAKQQYAEDAERHMTTSNSAIRMNGVFTVKEHIVRGLKNVLYKSENNEWSSTKKSTEWDVEQHCKYGKVEKHSYENNATSIEEI